MNWSIILNMSRFTMMEDVFRRLGVSKFRLGSRPIYYLGNGFLLSYTTMMFDVINNNRVERGNEGEYALIAYYFRERRHLEAYFKLGQERYNFEGDILGGEFTIIESIKTDSTYQEIKIFFDSKSNCDYYREGETRALKDGKFLFQNNFVTWGNYNFLFFGTGENTKMAGFEYRLRE